MIRKKIVFLPYDFDTAIGTNNEGSLVFSYNLEDIDSTEGGADVFNGQQSVLWKNLREMFGSELKEMYQNLRSTGAISYEKIEKAFEEHQSKWPEAIFNEDSWFKYLAPLEEKGSAAYLAMLQGSKAEQRKWWLYNRFKYIDSKYNAGDSLTDVITLRGYAKANVTITPYADVYATVKYGSYLVQTRAQRNQSYEMECPLDNVNDTEIYIYSASQLADIGDLSGLKVGYAEFVYATRLQQLILGSASPYYSNGNLQTLYLGNNKLLKKLDVRNCTGLGTGEQKTVDLSGCTGIEEVYFDGTKITGATLPNGGVLRILHLPDTITSLVVRNQPSITDFTCSSTAGVTTLWLENTGSTLDSLAILNTLPTGARVRLFGFYWELEDADEITDVLDTLDDKRGLDQNGDNTATAQVYGTIYVPNITGEAIAHAKERYPDITITYDHVTATLTYCDNDGTVLGSETITDGGNPASTPVLTTKEDERYNYTFLGWSKTQNGAVEEDALQNVTADTTVYAVYLVVEKTFTVRLYNGTVLFQTYEGVTYGASLTDLPTPEYTGAGDPDDYQFTGWDPLPENITCDLNCYAQFQFNGLYFRQLMNGTLTEYTDTQALTTIAPYAFAGETYLETVSMPSLTLIPASCFRGTPALAYADLPSAIAAESYAFSRSTVMTELVLPEFTLLNSTPLVAQMTAMTALRLPKNTSGLSGFASSVSKLELLDVGVTDTLGQNFNTSVFLAMKYFIMRNATTVVTPNRTPVFWSASPIGLGEGKILVPSAMVDTYKADANWSTYADYIEAIEDNPDICG